MNFVLLARGLEVFVKRLRRLITFRLSVVYTCCVYVKDRYLSGLFSTNF